MGRVHEFAAGADCLDHVIVAVAIVRLWHQAVKIIDPSLSSNSCDRLTLRAYKRTCTLLRHYGWQELALITQIGW